MRLKKGLIFPLIALFLIIIVGCAGPRRPPQPAQAVSASIGRMGGNGQAPAQGESVVQNETQQNTPVQSSNTATECPTDHFLNVQPVPTNATYPNPDLSVTCAEDVFVINSNGIPNFEFIQITPNDLTPQNYRWEIPLNPQPAAEPTALPRLGTVAVAVNGVPIYGPNEAAPQGWGDPYLDEILDFCNGHTAFRGEYHFHARPDCLFEDIEGNPALVVAYALDGYPILAPYACEDTACSLIKKVESSWQRTQNVQAAWEAHEYVAGSGDLDRCNGMILADGSYAYFATDTFPYFLGCYRGVVD